MSQNLFQSLFVYRARPGISPQENFLTEAFAYQLRTCPAFCRGLLRRCTGHLSPGDELTDIQVDTQVCCRAGDGVSPLYPDLRIRFRCGGEATEVLSEHKWNSPIGVEQLRRYAALPVEPGITQRRVVFIAPRQDQVNEARGSCDAALMWSDVVKLAEGTIADDTTEATRLLRQFTDFLRLQGLVPVVLDAARRSSNEQYGVEVAKALRDERFSWACLPNRLRRNRRLMGLRKHQAGVDFGDADGPIIFAGFFLDGHEQPVPMCNPAGGIDLVAVLFAKPPRSPSWQALTDAKARVKAHDPAASVLAGKEAGMNWVKLSVRRSLQEIAPEMTGSKEECEMLYEVLDGWCQAMFEGGVLEEDMRTAWVDGW